MTYPDRPRTVCLTVGSAARPRRKRDSAPVADTRDAEQIAIAALTECFDVVLTQPAE